ncbi:MAG: AAA family ATPase [Campylobacterota bacterium]|nr:AAA family ATPase [Campylobacterota bacterium]
MNPQSFPYNITKESFFHPIEKLEVIETHISWIVLTGRYAYKIKKAIEFDFLDYSTLEKRNYFCLEELRLNQRLASDLYLEVVAITGSYEKPCFDGEGEIVEYGVKMKQFDPSKGLDCVELTPNNILQLANQLVSFHRSIAIASMQSEYATPAKVYQPMVNNFNYIQKLDGMDQSKLQSIEEWTKQSYQILQNRLQERKREGYVRECHGDMHLANMILIDDKVTIFDGIEFNASFRWIDTMSELAFTLMDLEFRGYQHYATLLLNEYLEQSGDYEGLSLLNFYKTYRSMVRAKIAAIEFTQSSQRDAYQKCNRYLDLAYSYTQVQKPLLMITYGFSGSGKSSFVKKLLEHVDAIVLRSDVHRKRILEQNSDLYQEDRRNVVYAYLLKLATTTIEAGYHTIVDATFLSQKQRKAFTHLANQLGVEFVILACQSEIEMCKERILERQKRNLDPSDATVEVLNHQIAHYEPLSQEEKEFAVEIYNCDLKEMNKVLKCFKPKYS